MSMTNGETPMSNMTDKATYERLEKDVTTVKSDIAALLGMCRSNGTFLVLDEAFIDFCEEDSAKDLIGGYQRAVLLRSMTKFFAIPGLRLGYAIGAPETIRTDVPASVVLSG